MAKQIVQLPISVVDELDLPWNNVHESHIETNDHGDATYEIVFEYDGRLLSTAYTQTRNDGIYWDYDMEEKRPKAIECVVVRAVEKTVVVYVEVEDDSPEVVPASKRASVIEEGDEDEGEVEY